MRLFRLNNKIWPFVLLAFRCANYCNINVSSCYHGGNYNLRKIDTHRKH